MTQTQFMLIFQALPILCGLIFGAILWKFRKTYILAVIMLIAGAVWWLMLSNINLHGNEGPGLILYMYICAVSAFLVVELMKFIIKIINRRKNEQ